MKSALFSFFSVLLLFIFKLELWTFLFLVSGGIDVSEAQDLISKGAIIYDVRTPEEIAVSSLRGSNHFNIETNIPTDRPVLFVCTLGLRSYSLYTKFKEKGYANVYHLAGGYFRWLQKGGLIYFNGKPTDVIHPYSSFFEIFLDKGLSSFALSSQPESQN
jgi:rhodanese-related sulfurtransferase